MRWTTIGICIGVLGVSVLGCNLSSIKDLGVPCSDVEGIKLESGMCILQNKDGNIEELCEGCNEIDKNLCHKYISNGVFEFNRCPPEYVCSTVKSGGELAANASFCSLRRGDDALSCTSEQIYICDKEGNSTCERSCQYCDPQYMCYRIVGTEDGGEKCENAERKCDEDKSYLCVNGQWEDNAECAYGCNTKKGWCNTCLEDANICTADHKCARNGECVEKTCLDDPAICQPSQKCNADGKCVAKTCLEDASVCTPEEKCSEDGECVAKTCLDDPAICLASQMCNADGKCVAKTCLDDAGVCAPEEKCSEDGKCVAKTCLDDASVCAPEEKCSEEGKCVAKTCLDEPSVCSASEVCKTGVCLRKSCTEDASICGKSMECLEGECVSKKDENPELCNDAAVNYFWSDHFDLIDRILKSDASEACSIYEDMQPVLAKDGTILCSRTALCNHPETLMNCMDDYIQAIILGSYSMPSGYVNEGLNTGDVVRIYNYVNALSACEQADCIQKPEVCSEYQQCNSEGKCVPLPCRLKPEICGAHYQCIEDLCVRNTCDIDETMCSDTMWCDEEVKECRLPQKCHIDDGEEICSGGDYAYCKHKLVREVFYNNYKLIDDIAFGDKKTQCTAFSKMDKIISNEGKAVCNQIDYCSSGRAFYMCLANYITDIFLGSVDVPESYKDRKPSMAVANTVVNYYLGPENMCGGN